MLSRAAPMAPAGSPGALRRKGVVVARCTVERLMAELGLEGVIRGRRRRTTIPEPSAPRPPDLVDRDFTASRPDQLWVADMTHVRTWSGWEWRSSWTCTGG